MSTVLKQYRIAAHGTPMGIYPAATADEALEVYAVNAGYASFANLLEDTGDDRGAVEAVEEKPRIIVDNQQQAVAAAVSRVRESLDLGEIDRLYVSVDRTIRLSDDESEVLIDWDVRLTENDFRHDMTNWSDFDLDEAGRDDQSMITAIGSFDDWDANWDEDDSLVLNAENTDVLRDAAGYPRTKAEIARALGHDYEDAA